MVLHVIANIECEVVPRAIVGVGLIASVKHVVLGDKVSRHGMEPHAQEGPSNEIHQTLDTDEVIDEDIEHKLDHVVEDLKSGGRFGSDEGRSQGVEERLEEEPENLARSAAKEPTLPVRGEVHVVQIHAQVAVVLRVVLLEGDGHGDPDGQVGPHTKQTI